MAHELEGGASGALAGAALGAGAGPPGVVTGAIVGGVVGAVAGVVLDRESSRRLAHTKELDEEIGVMGGDLGAPNLQHPPSSLGAPSPASSGVPSSQDQDPAEGPMQVPEG
jgi:hypothetical protein